MTQPFMYVSYCKQQKLPVQPWDIFIRAVILVLESIPIIGVSDYWVNEILRRNIYLYSQFIEFNIQVLHTHSKCRYNNSAQ